MSKPNRRPRALRPSPELLESRKLMTVTKTINGRDADGDTWVLRLLGPGDLEVLKQPDAAGNPTALDDPTQIDQIVVGGADPLSTRLVGKVTPGPGGDGRVYFDSLTEVGGRSLAVNAGSGIQTIDLPDFWLGNTSNAPVSATNLPPSISVPDGVITLRLGGVDTTFGPQPAATSTLPVTPNNIVVNLGLPRSVGTSIVVGEVISSTTPGASTGTAPPTSTPNGVLFRVNGRLNLFQADTIVGDPADVTSGFADTSQGGLQLNGGTLLVSTVDPETGVTGQIGNVRIGGDATNFSTQTNDRISNFYVGGETQNITVLAPEGARNVSFGKGMDTVNLYTHTIENLQANRGALNSQVQVSRSIGRILFGGDVVNTNVLSGYEQDLDTAFSNQQAPSPTPSAQVGGGLTALIAGDVIDSVFAASVDPVDDTFGSNDLEFPHGEITAKVEGTIDNTNATPDSPTQAFFARNVNLTMGPVVPPAVPEAPFATTEFHRGQAGLRAPTTLNRPNQTASTTPSRASTVPQGPRARNRG